MGNHKLKNVTELHGIVTLFNFGICNTPCGLKLQLPTHSCMKALVCLMFTQPSLHVIGSQNLGESTQIA